MSARYPNRKSRFFSHYLVVLGAVFFCGASLCSADVLRTGSGESLTGDLTRIAEGILVFRTSLRGQMMLPMSEVRSLQTEGRWIVDLADGTVHIGTFSRQGILPDSAVEGDGRFVPLAFAAVVSAQKAPPLPAPEASAAGEPLWRAEAGVGVQSQFGTQDSVAPIVTLDVARALEEHDLGLRMRFDIPSTEAVGDFAQAQLSLIPRRPRVWAPYFRAEAARNQNESLDWRTGLALGVRYEFAPDAEWSLGASLGIAGYHSAWRGGEAGPLSRGGRREEATRGGVQLGIDHSVALWGNGRWDNRLTLNPGSSPGSAFRAEAESALTYPLSSRLQLRFDMLVSYEDDPVFDTLEPVDTSLGASVRFRF